MSKIIKLNFDRKVRYIFDKDTEEHQQLGERVADHFGSFFGNSWVMDDVKRFHKVLRECGLSVSEFLSREWPKPEQTPKPTPKTRKRVATKKTSAKKVIRNPKTTPKKSKKSA